jgi:hypothetical protein
MSIHFNKTGAEQWRAAVPGIVAANVAPGRVADASPAAISPMTVNVIAMERRLVGADPRGERMGKRIDLWSAPP